MLSSNRIKLFFPKFAHIYAIINSSSVISVDLAYSAYILTILNVRAVKYFLLVYARVFYIFYSYKKTLVCWYVILLTKVNFKLYNNDLIVLSLLQLIDNEVNGSPILISILMKLYMIVPSLYSHLASLCNNNMWIIHLLPLNS